MSRNLRIEDRAFDELAYWIQYDRKTAINIMELIEAVKRTSFLFFAYFGIRLTTGVWRVYFCSPARNAFSVAVQIALR